MLWLGLLYGYAAWRWHRLPKAKKEADAIVNLLKWIRDQVRIANDLKKGRKDD